MNVISAYAHNRYSNIFEFICKAGILNKDQICEVINIMNDHSSVKHLVGDTIHVDEIFVTVSKSESEPSGTMYVVKHPQIDQMYEPYVAIKYLLSGIIAYTNIMGNIDNNSEDINLTIVALVPLFFQTFGLVTDKGSTDFVIGIPTNAFKNLVSLLGRGIMDIPKLMNNHFRFTKSLYLLDSAKGGCDWIHIQDLWKILQIDC